MSGVVMRSMNVSSRLYGLRWIEIVCQVLVLWVAQYWLALERSQLLPMAAIVAVLALLNILTGWRLRRAWPLTNLEVFGQLCVDVLALGALLYFSGGPANPFVSLFLLPLTITAAILPATYVWVMAGLTLACYTLLLFLNVPLPPQRVELPLLADLAQAVTSPGSGHVHALPAFQDTRFALHILGMWLNFFVSAAIIAFFLARIAATLRARDRELAAAREKVLRNEQILALGTLAAGAAHQLSTPLSTIAVVVRELELEHPDELPLQASLGVLRHQVDSCKKLLSQLLNAAGRPRGEGDSARGLNEILQDLVDKWRLLRPRTVLTANWGGEAPVPRIRADPSLEQALLNLLDNAADASPSAVEMSARWDAQGCVIEILDRGPGLAAGTVQELGQPFFTTKREQGGVGIGLFLTNATLERCGGNVELFDRSGGGACTRITLPLGPLKA